MKQIYTLLEKSNLRIIYDSKHQTDEVAFSGGMEVMELKTMLKLLWYFVLK